MNTSPRPNSVLVAAALAFLAGAAILLAGVRLASGAQPPDPVVLADHADAPPPCLERGVPLVNPPPTVLKPGLWARVVAFGRDLGKRTGGSGVVLALGAIVDRVRNAKPELKRGRVGRFTLGLWAALLWTAGSLATGATWATAVSGVVLALITGAVWAAVPPPKGETAATPGGAA